MRLKTLLIACIALFPWWHASSAPRPNVLLIMVDDMGFSDLGSYGGEIDTPNLDKLAEGGVRFTQFYNTGRCWPTRISLMTGKYPHQAGHAMNSGPDRPRAYAGHTPAQGTFIPEVLKEAGYHNYHVGKWHMDNRRMKEQPNPTWPLQRGFEKAYWVRTQHNFFNPWRLMDGTELIERPAGDDPMGNGEYYLTTDFTERTLEYLQYHEENHDDAPFFLYLAHTAPHFPLHALPEDIARFEDGRYEIGWDRIREERLQRMKAMGIVNTELSARDEVVQPWDSFSPEDQKMWATRMAIHAAMIYRVDVGIGRIMEALEASGELEDTLILFLSDNGASAEYLIRGDGHDPEAPPGSGASYLCLETGWANASNTPFRQHKMWTHEGGIATPLIAHWPAGIPESEENSLVEEMGHVIDVMPTLAALAGEESPEVPGRSLLPLLQGESRSDPEFLFWEHVGHRAIRRGDLKLVAEFGKDWELYDLSADRAEMNDLSEERPEVVENLRRQWQSYADEIGVVPWETLPESRRTPSPEYRTK